MNPSNVKRAIGLAAIIATVTAGSAFAAVTTDSAVTLMASPSANSKIVAKLDADASVSITRTDKSWCKIDAAGTVGWVSCSELNGATPKPVASASTSGWSGYDFSTDPIMGVGGAGNLHQQGNGQFF